MRVAICLSGQPRNSELCHPFIMDNIVNCNKEHDFDFFIHTWEGSDGSSSWESSIDGNKSNIIDLYKPKLFEIEQQKEFSDYIGGYPSILGEFNQIKRVKSMFYSILKCNKLKSKFESDNNFKYDCVIRLRFDFQIETPLILDMDLNMLSVKNEKSHDEWAINDHIAISNSKNMDTYSDLYNNIFEICKIEKCPFNPEIILGRHIKINNIKLNKIYIDCIIRRYKSFEQNAKYWSPHR
jgi:hypothetical protein